MRRPTKLLLGGLGAYLAANVILPYALVQVLNLGLLRQGRAREAGLALTFDDGPDPETTPQVLDLLREAGVPATFFVLSERAEAHPELIERMLVEGHQVEAHGVLHRHAWTRAPWSVWRDVREAAGRLERLTGRRPRFYRPPHGAYTLATVLALRAEGLTGAHWTVEAHDWRLDHTPEQVTARVLAHARPGGVIVMHDAGPGAENSIPALPGLIAELKAREYTFRTLEGLQGAAPVTPADLPRRLLNVVDARFDRKYGVRRAGVRANSGFRLGPSPLSQDVTLHDGTVFRQGTPGLEIHIDSFRMVDVGIRYGVTTLMPRALQDVARELESDPVWKEAPFIFTVGTFWGILEPFGFELHPAPPFTAWRLTLWTRLIRRVFQSDSLKRPLEAKMAIIRRGDLIARYKDLPRRRR